MNSYDVAIVGGGFAGVVAARELTRLGCSSIILEGRDRLGGRTWVDKRLGVELEMGGTWVHWLQPHVWAEITRYGIGTHASPTPERAIWLVDGERYEACPEELYAKLDSSAAVADAATAFPNPYDPLEASTVVAALDSETMADRLAATELPPDARALISAIWSVHFHGPLEEGALTQALRWVALAAWDPDSFPLSAPPTRSTAAHDLFWRRSLRTPTKLTSGLGGG